MTTADRGQDRARIERKARSQDLAVLAQVPPIAVGVGYQQDDDANSAVAALQCNASIERLQVEQPHLGFDPNDSPLEDTLRVPSPLVARDRKGNFGPPRSPVR